MTLPNFERLLKEYAYLITKVGVNIQKANTVVIQASVGQAILTRLITKKAYKLGAAEGAVTLVCDSP